jgi:glycosyltransferase involved in cell wall biosynthesis
LPINPRLPGPLRLLQSVKFVRTIITSAVYLSLLAVRLWRYDVIHVFSASYLSFLLAPTPAILLGRLFGKKVVLNYHSGEAEDHLRRWGRTAIPTLRAAHVLVVPSDYLVGVLARFGLQARAIANSIDGEGITFRPRKPERPVLLCNRNLEPHYNVECVLRAFEQIRRRRPAARLILAGDGSQRKRLNRAARELDLVNLEFVGAVSPAEMARLYDSADIFVNASNIDNMPLSILEAFAAGLPVVSTRAGGIPHVVDDEHTGLLVECNDCRGLAAAVLRLVDDPDLAARLADSARARSQALYRWKAVEGAWLDLYSSLVSDAEIARPGSQRVEPLESVSSGAGPSGVL